MNDEREARLQQLLEQRLSNLNQDLERVWWQDGTQVRARGVQLSMRRLWLILLVVVGLMVALCVASMYRMTVSYEGPPEPLPTVEETTPEPSPTPAVGSAAVPESALLNPNDVDAGFAVAATSQGPAALRLALNACVGTTEDAVAHWLGTRGLTFSGPGGASIDEEISAFDVGWGAAHMSEWRQRIGKCPTYDPGGGTRTSLSTVDLPGVGAEAFLVRREVTVAGGTGYVAWSAFVRQGDLVAFVGENQGESFVRDVAAKAAGRLCAAVC